jgi:hypothetical protein
MAVNYERLSTKERAALLALLGAARPLSNPELEDLAGFRLQGAERRRLSNLGLVKSEGKPGRAFSHELTADGRAWCANELTAGPGSQQSKVMEGALYLVLGGLAGHLERTGLELREVFQTDANSPGVPVSEQLPADGVHARIESAYRKLADGPGDYVPLHELRMLLSDIGRADIDAALGAMYRAHLVNLVSQANQEALTDADRVAALEIGGSRKHRIAIERP